MVLEVKDDPIINPIPFNPTNMDHEREDLKIIELGTNLANHKQSLQFQVQLDSHNGMVSFKNELEWYP